MIRVFSALRIKVFFSFHVYFSRSQIVIAPDSLTGEYIANLYPVKYKITNISADGYNSLFPTGTTSQILDLSNVFNVQTSSYADTAQKTTDSLTYNAKFNRIYRVNTSLTYQQYENGSALNYFGDQNYLAQNLAGHNDSVPLYDSKTNTYLFGYPVFHMQSITFTVNPGTNVGKYDEVIYVKGDNNVAEALPITLKVFDEQPDWSVDPTKYRYNMSAA